MGRLASVILKKKLPPAGFTLVETIIALALLAVTLCGLLLTYLHMFILADMVRDQALGINAVQAKLEEIQNIPFDNLSSAAGSFNLTSYGFASNQSKGRVDVTQNFGGYTGALTQVRVVASYRSRNRTIGEDANFNGQWDVGEDINATGYAAGRLDSPTEAVTLIAK